jgi:hypothetical protein
MAIYLMAVREAGTHQLVTHHAATNPASNHQAEIY